MPLGSCFIVHIARNKKLTYTETHLKDFQRTRESERGGEVLGKFEGEFIIH